MSTQLLIPDHDTLTALCMLMLFVSAGIMAVTVAAYARMSKEQADHFLEFEALIH